MANSRVENRGTSLGEDNLNEIYDFPFGDRSFLFHENDGLMNVAGKVVENRR